MLKRREKGRWKENKVEGKKINGILWYEIDRDYERCGQNWP
jgi:hypothetical protein